jgi:F-BAR domain only protein
VFRSAENKRATWKLGDISSTSENGGQGSLIAAFELSPESTVTLPSLAAAQFSIEGTTLSGVDFEIAGSGYRMSLLKRRVATGKCNLQAVNVSNFSHVIFR